MITLFDIKVLASFIVVLALISCVNKIDIDTCVAQGNSIATCQHAINR